MFRRHALSLFLYALLCILSACSPQDRQAADKLNSVSYAYHYRSLDSTAHYARMAFSLSDDPDVRSEALNNLAFVSIARMHYDEARRQLDSIPGMTDNQIELLVSYIQQMRLCQRRSSNREFYTYRELAYRAMARIHEDWQQLSEHQQQRWLYARTELAIVESTYFYYVGQELSSVQALQQLSGDLSADTAQWLNYLYNVGSGGIVSADTQEEVDQIEFDHLMRCYLMAQQGNYPYFMANALEAIAEHLAVPATRERLVADNYPAMKFLTQHDEPSAPADLPIQLAEQSLALFQDFGDVYQIAGAYRTLATSVRSQGDYTAALRYLEESLSDSAIYQAPDLIASIREQLSVAYAALNDKPLSDHNRNLYLDLQEQTRQDRSLEARADQLEQTLAQLNNLLCAVVAAILLLLFFLWLFNYLHHRGQQNNQFDALLQPLRAWETRNKEALEQLQEREEELREQLAISRQHVETGRQLHLEQRAKVSLVHSITPFIDRLLHEVKALPKRSAAQQEEGLAYIRELTDKINEQNDVLTDWIQLRRGELSLHIESFALQSLFDVLAKGRASFAMKGVSLMIEPTAAHVKADRVLTLFMLNTLADNARKFTDAGGQVTVGAEETADYVEVSVSDTGAGMDEEQLAHLFERKPIMDVKGQASHGFGLLNCKGIIDKYRKVSQIFSVCELRAESRLGQGSRLSFRLPKGVVRLLLLLTFGLTQATVQAGGLQEKAKAFADSAYFANVEGEYLKTLLYIDSCRHCLNDYYRQLRPAATDTMLLLGDASVMANEIRWYHDSITINYDIILDIRNEAAVAALALHEWELYTYNNRIYTQLFKERSADSSLDSYCRTMQQSQTNCIIAIVLLFLVLVAILPAYYFLYYRHRLYQRFCVERVKSVNDILLSDATDQEKLQRIAPLSSERMPEPLQDVVSQIVKALEMSVAMSRQHRENIELAEDEWHKSEQEEAALHVSNAVLDNCLSTLKHETMYFPSRIRQLVDRRETASLPEVAEYYRELYGILSMQAMHQVEGNRLHLTHLDHEILGDESLVRYLFDVLRRVSGQRKLDVAYQPYDGHFVEVRVSMPSLQLTAEQAASLFEPHRDHIPYLICRQIVREHGEAIHRTDFGLKAETENNHIVIILKLPRQICRNSKSSS